MKKRGFTLVELIAVVVIIGSLALLVLPTIENKVKESNEKVYQTQLDNIILSLKNWATDNQSFLPSVDADSLNLTLAQLKTEGYIEYEVKNPLTGKCFSNDMLLEIKKNKKNYDYFINIETISEQDTCKIDMESPSILLNGKILDNVEINSIYENQGVIARDKDGNDITESVSVTISGSGTIIDTGVIGNKYIVKYSVINNGKTSEIMRTVKIVDTTAPNLVVPADITIDITVDSFDLLENVSATDNSGETIEITTIGSISLGIVGRYKITYIAMDSSNNKTIKNRIINVVQN